MITIPEAKIHSPAINSHKEILFRIRVKQEDYTHETFEKLCELSDSGQPVVILLNEFQRQQEDNTPKLRQRLALLIRDYATQQGMEENDEIGRLYKKYNITSRANLTNEQLIEEIKSYEAGINYLFN